MTYQSKPGTFTLFKNERKEKETHPDYKGDGADHDGSPIEVAAWLKKTSGGKTFMSCTFKPKEAREKPAVAQKPASDSFDNAEDIPF